MGKTTGTNGAKLETVAYPAMTYNIKLDRGTRGSYSVELTVNNAPSREIAIREVKSLQAQLFAAMPEVRS